MSGFIPTTSLIYSFNDAVPVVETTCINSYTKFSTMINEETTKSDLNNILNLFDIYGLLNGNDHTNKPILDIDTNLSATTHSDLYKFMMVHVFKVVEKVNKGVTVRFSVDFRDDDLENTLLENIERLRMNLERLCEREFNENIFNTAYNKTNHLSYKTTGLGGKLANKVTNIRTDIKTKPTDVEINVFTMEIDGKKKLIVEAVGPWHKVTWLETSMMQACYETYLRIKLNDSKKSYGAWLKEALFRCYLSIEKANDAFESSKNLSGALFSGRRTGGYAFTLLQVYLISKLYKGIPPFRGTSSVDAHWQLNKMIIEKTVTGIDNGNLLPPVGTHAHEQSMGLQGVLKEQLGDNPQLPLSQLLAHYLYFKVVKQKSKAPPMPMLADTLSTKAFLLTGGLFNEDGSPNTKGTGNFLHFILSSRQDSGELADIQKTIRDATNKRILKAIDDKGKSMGIMASEISTPDDLQKIVNKMVINENDIDDYNSFGAGGFFGDGHKAWKCVTPIFQSPSLAVKSTEVFTNGSAGYSIKLSDSDGKLSLLKTDDANVQKILDKVVKNSEEIKAVSNIDISKLNDNDTTNPLLQYRTDPFDLQNLMKEYDKVADELYPYTQSAGKRRRTRKRSRRSSRRYKNNKKSHRRRNKMRRTRRRV